MGVFTILCSVTLVTLHSSNFCKAAEVAESSQASRESARKPSASGFLKEAELEPHASSRIAEKAEPMADTDIASEAKRNLEMSMNKLSHHDVAAEASERSPMPHHKADQRVVVPTSVLSTDAEADERAPEDGKKSKEDEDKAAKAAANMEKATVAALLGYKMLNQQYCPDTQISVPGLSSGGMDDKSYTYGFGCGHPDVKCSCPKYYMEGCNDIPLPAFGKFGFCKIAWWFYAGVGFVALSILGCVCMCCMKCGGKPPQPQQGGKGKPGGDQWGADQGWSGGGGDQWAQPQQWG
jgi:hypothetical protein